MYSTLEYVVFFYADNRITSLRNPLLVSSRFVIIVALGNFEYFERKRLHKFKT
jgi:hypothetical protein